MSNMEINQVLAQMRELNGQLQPAKPAEEVGQANFGEILRQAVDEGRNPRDVKFELGVEIVTRFHDEAVAEAAREEFISRFREGAMPEDMPEVTLEAQDGTLGIAHLLKGAGLVSSTSEAFRMIKQGAVRIDGERVEDRGLSVDAGSTNVYQVGRRRFARVSLA